MDLALADKCTGASTARIHKHQCLVTSVNAAVVRAIY